MGTASFSTTRAIGIRSTRATGMCGRRSSSSRSCACGSTERRKRAHCQAQQPPLCTHGDDLWLAKAKVVETEGKGRGKGNDVNKKKFKCYNCGQE
eukprot:gene6934-2640_t